MLTISTNIKEMRDYKECKGDNKIIHRPDAQYSSDIKFLQCNSSCICSFSQEQIGNQESTKYKEETYGFMSECLNDGAQ